MRRFVELVFGLGLCGMPLQAQECELPKNCVESGWQVGIAMGLGARSNPLVGGDQIPLVLMPDLAWYGENAYFDNGEFGTQMSWHDDDAFDIFAMINREHAYFDFWHPQNLFLQNSFLAVDNGDRVLVSSESIALNIEHIGERYWAVDGGLRWHHYWANSEWQIAILNDISGVHNGQQLQLRYLRQFEVADGQLQLLVGATWKSRSLIDYYYGIDQHDRVAPELYYQGQAGWQPELGLSYSRTIDEHWQWLLRANVVLLNRGMSDSPIVEDRRVNSFFAGVSYSY